jgi:hypothetical protein
MVAGAFFGASSSAHTFLPGQRNTGTACLLYLYISLHIFMPLFIVRVKILRDLRYYKLVFVLTQRRKIMKRRCVYLAAVFCLAAFFALPSFTFASHADKNKHKDYHAEASQTNQAATNAPVASSPASNAPVASSPTTDGPVANSDPASTSVAPLYAASPHAFNAGGLDIVSGYANNYEGTTLEGTREIDAYASDKSSLKEKHEFYKKVVKKDEKDNKDDKDDKGDKSHEKEVVKKASGKLEAKDDAKAGFHFEETGLSKTANLGQTHIATIHFSPAVPQGRMLVAMPNPSAR